MQLDEFIAETLTQITNGVRKARENTGFDGIGVRPTGQQGESSGVDLVRTLDPQGYVTSAQSVRFDVALTVSEDKGTNAKVGVISGILNGSGAVDSNYLNSTVSRVQFAIPVLLPTK